MKYLSSSSPLFLTVNGKHLLITGFKMFFKF